MQYVASASIKLKCFPTNYNKNEWIYIKNVNNIKYYFCIHSNYQCEIVSGIFIDEYEALNKAKQMYISLCYYIITHGIPVLDSGCDIYGNRMYHKELDGNLDEYIKKEKYFFNTSNCLNHACGPNVYEVNSKIEDFFKIKFLYGNIIPQKKYYFNFSNIDKYIFTYSKKSQQLLSNVFLAESSSEIGMKMTIYCGILESLAICKKKNNSVIKEINYLKEHVEHSKLLQNDKNQLLNFLETGKSASSRQKCKDLIKKYSKKTYRGISVSKIFDEAYNLRSQFSHGYSVTYDDVHYSYLIKLLVLDVIKNYILENEKDI